jgi:hypothetical protein
MHIAPKDFEPPKMTIARVRELAQEMAASKQAVVCSFTREQLMEVLDEIDRRTTPVTAPLSAIESFAAHRKACDVCRRGPDRCDPGKALYAAACISLVDQAKLLL